MIRILLLLVALASFASSSSAIVVRHDRDDADYRALAQKYPMACEVGGGTGTLIHPEWVLTAGHVADGFAGKGGVVRFPGREAVVEAKFVHPDYGKGDRHRDLGLLKLAEPVQDIVPARLYRAEDETGQAVIFVGNGYTGTGQTGPDPGERIWRAAQNTVERVEPGWVVFQFDAPPDGDELEGISGPGDSGGPALVETEDGVSILGVSAFNDGAVACTYGSQEFYARVSTELEWIDAVMAGDAPADEPRAMKFGEHESGQRTVEREVPVVVAVPPGQDETLWSLVEALAAACASGSEPDFLALFEPSTVEAQAAKGDPLPGLLEFMAGVHEVRGPIVGYHPLGSDAFEVSALDRPLRRVVFHLEDGTPGYFGLALSENDRIEHLSLFVQPGICQHGTPCPLARPLAQARRGN